MPNHLELPDDFRHLIEKREGERRESRAEDPPLDAQVSPPGEERRQQERRGQKDRAT